MITLHKVNVPSFLRHGALYKALDQDDENFSIPAGCFKTDLNIDNDQDLSVLLSTLRFWGVDIIHTEVVQYVAWRKPREIIAPLREFSKELRYVEFLEALCKEASNSNGRAIEPYKPLPNISFSANLHIAAAQLCLYQYDNMAGKIWNAHTCALAARFAQPALLKYLHEHGCPWDAEACSSASAGHSLECLMYAHEHGCPWDATTVQVACQWDALDCLEYAVEHGCPWNWDGWMRDFYSEHASATCWQERAGWYRGCARPRLLLVI